MPLATAVRSVAESNKRYWPLEIYVLANGFSEDAKKTIADSQPAGACSIHWAPVDLTPFAGFSTLPHISSTTYARLLIPKILPAGVAKALYLDADLLVLDDLGPILQLDLDGAALGAVLDARLDTHAKMGNTKLAGLPFPRVRDYFNAGVLLIDLARWRSERIAEKAVEYLNGCPDSVYSDQDALNVACDGVWKQLHPRWNCYQIDLNEPVGDLAPAQRPGIIHFHGWSKPWDPAALNCNAKFYDAFRARTLFGRTAAEKLKALPIVFWAWMKSTLKRSAVIGRVWHRLRSRRPSEGRTRARRLPAQ